MWVAASIVVSILVELELAGRLYRESGNRVVLVTTDFRPSDIGA